MRSATPNKGSVDGIRAPRTRYPATGCLAWDPESSAALDGRFGGGEPVDECLDELTFVQHRISSRVHRGLVQRGMHVTREGEDAHAGMVAPQPCDRGNAVEERHVQVD